MGCSPTFLFLGLGVGRQGDPAICELHGKTNIAEGAASFRDRGVPIALHMHRCLCGCRLVSSLAASQGV
nr:PAAR domain-containing protein [Pandoraea iniqua]